MKRLSTVLSLIIAVILFTSCSNNNDTTIKKVDPQQDTVAANIKMYTHVWDEIINKGKLDLFNDSNFTKDVIFHMKPANVTGIDSARAYYANFLTSFSEIKFTFKEVFGQGDMLVKKWNFSGKHTGVFFGIPPTNKSLSLDSATIVKMRNGKIAEEEDFFDNADMMNQLGIK